MRPINNYHVKYKNKIKKAKLNPKFNWNNLLISNKTLKNNLSYSYHLKVK